LHTLDRPIPEIRLSSEKIIGLSVTNVDLSSVPAASPEVSLLLGILGDATGEWRGEFGDATVELKLISEISA
jgi:hypothetical protein